MFYNTNKETGNELKESENITEKQDELVLSFFRQNRFQLFTAYELQQRVFGGRVPKTSVHRSLSDLTYAGLLQKTNVMVRGPFDRQVHTWKLAR